MWLPPGSTVWTNTAWSPPRPLADAAVAGTSARAVATAAMAIECLVNECMETFLDLSSDAERTIRQRCRRDEEVCARPPVPVAGACVTANGRMHIRLAPQEGA